MEKNTRMSDSKAIFLSHIKYIAIFYVLGFVIAYLLYSVFPKYYRASARILQPPSREAVSVKLETDTRAPAAGSTVTHTELFISILNSRSIKDSIIENFNLSDAYNTKNKDAARKRLEKLTSVSLAAEKFIEIAVIDRNPRKAADIANFFVLQLENTVNDLYPAGYKQDRLFIENRIRETEEKIEALQSTPEKMKGNRINALMDTQEAVYKFLALQLEEAKINEVSHTPVIKLLDQAVVPESIYRPNLRFFILLQTGIILSIGILVLFFDLLKYLGNI